MNELQVFKNSEFGELGVLTIEGKEYFPATACAKILGYANPRDAIKRHCKVDGVVKHDGVSITENQHGKASRQVVSTNYVNEGNLYRLIVSSKLPAAEKFERWVFDEVLPALRKQGAYVQDIQGIITQTATAVVAEVLRQLIPVITQSINMGERSAKPEPTKPETVKLHEFEEVSCNNQCKLETFPSNIRDRVDALMFSMIEQQAANFSQIARFCTISGYTISSPSVKTYYQRRFNAG